MVLTEGSAIGEKWMVLLMSLSGWFCPVGLKLNILSRWVLVEGLTGESDWKF